MQEHHIAADDAVEQIAGELRQVKRNYPQDAGGRERPQRADRAERGELDYIGVLGFQRIAVAEAAEKDAESSDRVALFKQFLDQRHRFAAALSPDHVIARADYPGEVEIAKIYFFGHRRCGTARQRRIA